ncbi:Arc family DNA-binding protein [Mesorhizobium wenxiniae]|uniref:Arc-like DNA binding domain-containing protein n=1 Tax=Mesorhizobium wenxiniae TaxID=2014805 RepID=A0A271KFE2_9HYPH|nr:Arc family DNA-binding protein [Mesorhizobium wenxiniae]PAP94502.1 hypothetical protein CIT31_16010 [Mesorhizobium wenxiniae]
MSDDDREKYPSELAERFQVRLPPGLRDRIKEAADKNSRSMNAEIVARLEDFPTLQKTLFATTRERAKLADDKERLEWELDRLEDFRKRFFNKDGKPAPVLAIPQPLLDRISLEAEQNHRTLDAEAIAALEVAFPPKSIDINLLSVFLESLIGVSAPDGNSDYLNYINNALADAKQPWTVRAGWDGEVSFVPYATRAEQSNDEGGEE